MPTPASDCRKALHLNRSCVLDDGHYGPCVADESPSPEAKWTPLVLDEWGKLHAGTVRRGNEVCMDGVSIPCGGTQPAAVMMRDRMMACYNACQSIPGDPEMALRLAREALELALYLLEEEGYTEAPLACREALESLGYDSTSTASKEPT